MKMLLYSCKTKPYLYKQKVGNSFALFLTEKKLDTLKHLNGKIVGECDFEVEEINPSTYEMYDGFIYNNPQEEDKLKGACLSAKEMYLYLQDKTGYAIHIKNLKIFDKPKKLDEFYSIHNVGGMLLTDELKKAPQNMQRVSIQEWEYGTYNPNDIAVLISIQPQWLIKILNGEKTIEVRKKVLKGMIKNGK